MKKSRKGTKQPLKNKQTEQVVRKLHDVVRRIEALADDIPMRTTKESLEQLQDKTFIAALRTTQRKIWEQIETLGRRILRLEHSHLGMAAKIKKQQSKKIK